MVAHLENSQRLEDSIRYAEAMLPTCFGDFRCIVYRLEDGIEHVALVKGDIQNQPSVLVRLQSECLTGEVFASQKCDCKRQLEMSMERVSEEGFGVIIYLRQEGRGIGLGNKIKAYGLQDQGLDTVDANRMLGLPDDGRDFCCAVRIIRDLGLESVRLLTNNPKKLNALVNAGIYVTERVPLIAAVSPLAQNYMKAKCQRMGHFLSNERL